MKIKAFTLIEVLVVGAIISLLSYFAVPRLVSDHKLKVAEKGVVAAGDALAVADQKKTTAEGTTGRALQREATQATAVLGLFADSPQKLFISDRLGNIGTLSNQLYGPAPSDEADKWRALALAAFSANATERAVAAQQLSAQQATINDVVAKLSDAQKAKDRADTEAAHARAELLDARKQVDEGNSFREIAFEIGTFVAAFWLLSWVVGKLAEFNPAFAPAAAAMHWVLAPGLSALHSVTTKTLSLANEEVGDLVQRTGQLFGRVRADMPEVAAKLRSLGNEIFDEAHKDVIGDAADAAHSDILLKREEAKTLRNQS